MYIHAIIIWGNEFNSTLYHCFSLLYFPMFCMMNRNGKLCIFPFFFSTSVRLPLSVSAVLLRVSQHPEDILFMSHGNRFVVFCTLTLSLRFYVNSQVNNWMMVIVSECNERGNEMSANYLMGSSLVQSHTRARGGSGDSNNNRKWTLWSTIKMCIKCIERSVKSLKLHNT